MASSNLRASYRRYTTDLNQSRPRTVTLVKDKSGFGFTLRHFIVYPPTNFNSGKTTQELNKDFSVSQGQWKLDCKNKPMDTIFIREVKEDSPAFHAGLNKGDRILAINNHALSGKSYSEIIHLILRSGHTLHLLVVPKEDDILQLYFAASAYQPVHRENKHHKYHLPSFSKEQSNRLPNYGTYPGHNRSKLSNDRAKNREIIGYKSPETKLPNQPLEEHLSHPPHLACGFDKKENEYSLREKYLFDSSCFSEDEGYFQHSKELKRDSLADPSKLKQGVAGLYYTLCRDQPSVFSFSSEDNLNYPIYMSDFDDIAHCDNMSESKSITDALNISARSPIHFAYQCDRPCQHSCDNSECTCNSNSCPPAYWTNNKDPMGIQAESAVMYRKPGERNSISSTYDFRDNPNIPSINLVAQRRHQFESGNLLAESMERMNLYRSELSRMSKSNQARIVSSRTTMFENKSSSPPSLCYEKPVAIADKPKAISNDAVYVNTEEIKELNHKYDSGHRDNSNNKQVEHVVVCDDDSGQNVDSVDFNPYSVGVIHRRKTVPATTDQDECPIVRRISYLRATANERMNVESDLSEEDETSDVSSPNKEYRIQKLKSFFGEKTPKVKQAIDPVEINDIDNACDQETTDEPKTVYGWVICKVVSLEGKRSSDRSWRHLWAILRDNILYLLKERREPTKGSLMSDEHVINIKNSIAKVASDYVKRKHVLRLLLMNGTEYLVQTESHVSMMEWLHALQIFTREISKLPEWLRNTSVLEKAKAYEQHLHGPKSHAVKKLVFRHRNPSEHSPTIKSRRASQGDELALTKIGVLWRDRMLQGWKKVHGVNSHIPKSASFGVKLENAPPGISNEHIPLIVELCIQIVESRGLDMVGIYRVPGNNASVSLLTDMVNQGIDDEVLKDTRWNDVNIVSSLLKAYFRKLPEPLLTSHLYSKFIQASEIDDPVKRLKAIKHVLYHLPVHYFATLRFLMYHLKKVVEHSAANKMEARNLAIVFGPTLVRAMDNNMVAMVTDMPQQCYLIETLITYVEWLFEDCGEILPIEINTHDKRKTHPPSNIQSSALLNNINKLDDSADSLPHEMFASICNVASRHLRHRQKKKDPAAYSKKRSGIIADDTDILGQGVNGPISSASCDTKIQETESVQDVNFDSCSSLTTGSSKQRPAAKEQPLQNGSLAPEDAKLQLSGDDHNRHPAEEAVGHRYNKLSEMAQEKIRNFEQETKALLRRDFQRPRASVGTPQVEWEQIEKEWQKAKLELEQEDLLDYLADDPSYLSCLLSRGMKPDDLSPAKDFGLPQFYSGRTDFPRSLSSGKELSSCQSTRTLECAAPTAASRGTGVKTELSQNTCSGNSTESSRTRLEKPEIPMSVSQPALASVFSEKIAAATVVMEDRLSISTTSKAKNPQAVCHSEDASESKREPPVHTMDLHHPSDTIQSSNPS